ncbi:serine-type D-Ala-D-Ala carboxypeptidase [Thiocapsa imhoffii]|uniref:serine-type D-Ala-D-Ala carboxypeptidase n=1 Tax=Thiocapsa imhoffii TaxID=382777 RepID=A0A9X0WLK1_9GAMM|nr:D-alanyl-D-alanine carboxypeptidase family protein [Thiocapsa imhoffii]MBK1646620.1 serine-type D-Ala-D-Ala carboxypeptidase [Thiocapsa imhoffii]
MKPVSKLLLLSLLFVLPGVFAQTPQAIPDPPAVAAKGYLLIDFNSGQILAEKNADERLEPASLTKIMTGYVVFRELAAGKIALGDQVLISERAWRTGGSKMFVEVGKQVSIQDLLMGMIVQSGNDASVALAEHVAGSVEAFADLMNANAQRLGMTNSHFTNPHGLPDPELYITARDIALVAMAIVREFPEFYGWYSTREFTFNEITQHNRNPLLRRDESADGIKTGYTQAAGYCLVSSAKRNDMRLISVVMGSPTPNARADASLALMNYGFRYYESHLLYPADEPVESFRVWKGDQEWLPVGPVSDVFATFPRGRYAELAARLEKAEANLTAPIASGTPVGEVIVTFDGAEINRLPLIGLAGIEKGNLWQIARDSVLGLFQSQ